MSTLVIFEPGRAISWEAIAAAQQLGGPVSAAVIGGDPAELAAKKLDRVYHVRHELLTNYTADGYTAALAQLIAKIQPSLVLFPHTYQVRDYAPKLATRLGTVLVSDVIRISHDAGGLIFVRQMFQGKLNCDVRASETRVQIASLQAGSFRADAVEAGSAPVEEFAPAIEASAIRAKPQPPFREAQRAVDLGAAELIVSVGRGIKEKDNIGVVEELAQALGAELAASRPICDNGWLPMERQVGSSGQTVSPKLYLAVGISGAIQHLVGMKGSKNVVAINKDPDAPIFEIADYGIVGDLFEVVPAIVEEVKKHK
ncbi:MAG: electron transfer flavoprotein subunit alpha/FixB family protein [Bryobacteraceae bacterium]